MLWCTYTLTRFLSHQFSWFYDVTHGRLQEPTLSAADTNCKLLQILPCRNNGFSASSQSRETDDPESSIISIISMPSFPWMVTAPQRTAAPTTTLTVFNDVFGKMAGLHGYPSPFCCRYCLWLTQPQLSRMEVYHRDKLGGHHFLPYLFLCDLIVLLCFALLSSSHSASASFSSSIGSFSALVSALYS